MPHLPLNRLESRSVEQVGARLQPDALTLCIHGQILEYSESPWGRINDVKLYLVSDLRRQSALQPARLCTQARKATIAVSCSARTFNTITSADEFLDEGLLLVCGVWVFHLKLSSHWLSATGTLTD